MSIYITTPIFYASGNPHLGHAYSGFIADALKRYYQLKGTDAFLLTGTDENGQKIEQTAKLLDEDLEQFVENNSLLFRNLWKNLNITPDQFVRTTGAHHHQTVIEIWQKLFANGDIYLGQYEGHYCVECEQYYSEWQLHNNCCPIHNKPVDIVSEPSYLFRLDKYREKLLEIHTSRSLIVASRYFQKQLIHYLQQPKIDDLSISRTNTTWGIKVPNNDRHTIYVWLDALFSYLTALRSLTKTNQSLAQTIHVIGKDILQFHGIYWPAFLLAADLPLPEKIIVHGWWTLEGHKISKSNPLTSIDTERLVKSTTVDGLRYGLLLQKPVDRDGNLKIADLCETINSDLANNLGNLVKRFATLVDKHFTGHIVWKQDADLAESSTQLIKAANTSISLIDKAYASCDFQNACVLINRIISKTNAYIHAREPWKLNNPRKTSDVEETLCVVHAVLKIIYTLYWPIIPGISRKIHYQLRQEQHVPAWPIECEITDIHIRSPETIFERIPINIS